MPRCLARRFAPTLLCAVGAALLMAACATPAASPGASSTPTAAPASSTGEQCMPPFGAGFSERTIDANGVSLHYWNRRVWTALGAHPWLS